ncbi:MAG: TonB-dependent receptor [Salibacteraceae bacterium]
MKKSYTLLAIAVFITGLTAAQKGYLRGNIVDGDFGGPMISAAITVADQPGVGTTTDFDGNYSLPLDPGTYTINVSFISYATQTFEKVEIQAGEVTNLDAVLGTDAAVLDAVDVTAEVRRNNEVAMLLEMKNATSVSDGLSSQAFKKIGDSDLSGAIKRVTGVTVQGGKYVYVRGLGDRYTKTTLNGMSIPGLDPDVNAVQIDIFPTSILENVKVYKTFTPDLYGDFTGGLVDVVTKSFPEEKTTQVSFGVGFIPGMHFIDDFTYYEGGGLDFTGYDDGTRRRPFPRNQEIPAEVQNDPELEEITQSFNPTLATRKQTSLMNSSFSFNHGNQITKESGLSIGYNTVLNYSNQYTYYDAFESNDYLKDNDRSHNDLLKNITRKGDVGKISTIWSGLISGSLKKGNHSIEAMLLNTQNGEGSASNRVNQDFNQNQSILLEDVLTYTQRTLSSFMLGGTHRFGIVEMEWKNAFSYSRVYDPDFRETRISVTDGDTNLSTGNGSGIDRFWRNLNEINESARLDFKIPLSEKVVMKTGLASTIKGREFEVQNYKLRRTDISNISIDPNWFLEDENVWSLNNLDTAGNPQGTYTIGSFQPSNNYTARQTLFSGYLMLQHPVAKVVKMNYGVRVEKTDMYYTGETNTGSIEYNDEKTLDELNILPSINASIGLSEKMNLRIGANQSVARPSFKEKSIAQIYDPITKRTFVGNIDLEQTDILNFDLRWEYFMTARELLSLAVFYKAFDGHIEMVSFPTAPDNIKPRNSGSAEVFGAEFDLRKAITNDTSSKVLSRFFIGFNATIVQSQVDLKSVTVDATDGGGTQTEFDLRENNLREGQPLGRYRPMSGQSPYSINASISYAVPETKLNVSMAYNVQGEQLTIISSGRIPDIYTIPFHSLNFNAYRSFGEKLNHKFTLGVRNILDEDRTLVYRAYKAEDQIFTTFKPGRLINAKYTYTF